jgi:hypothetical protein
MKCRRSIVIRALLKIDNEIDNDELITQQDVNINKSNNKYLILIFDLLIV